VLSLSALQKPLQPLHVTCSNQNLEQSFLPITSWQQTRNSAVDFLIATGLPLLHKANTHGLG
jgi:hypothetical protein